MSSPVKPFSLFSNYDIYLFREGKHTKLYKKMGAHPIKLDDEKGTYFAVWAPNAERVTVFGDFNGWDKDSHPLYHRWDGSGIWEGFIPEVGPGTRYKYHIVSRYNNYTVDKADPYGFYSEVPPGTASVVWDLSYSWHDKEWMNLRTERNSLNSPVSIYEVHLGSWRRVPEEQDRYLTYKELAPLLADYLKEMGFTHVEFLPLMEHPFYGSWGYQITGYFAPTARYGTPQELMYLIDYLHQQGIAVVFDWVPSHFPKDEHGLSFFDGTHLYEHEDPRRGHHPHWDSAIFNYGRAEVKSFLLSSAHFWCEFYHVDGLRVDAVASMLYLDYGREQGQWLPNKYGGRENLEAIEFIRELNESLYRDFPGVHTFAEESTAWPMVSRPVYMGGLGFGMKWNMGWMHDTLEFFTTDPLFRKYHHENLTFSLWYAFSENFILPLSHDEVVYGKGSLYAKMPGDEWQKRANLRLLFGWMFAHPGKKLLFMGGEFAQMAEWNHDSSLQWHLLQSSEHEGIARWIRDLNYFYRTEPALYETDFDPDGFQWIDFHDYENSVFSFLRLSKDKKHRVVVVMNCTPVPRYNYRVGVPIGGNWKECLNSDAVEYGGSGLGNMGAVKAEEVPFHGRDFSVVLTLPPLGILFFKHQS